jgi:oxalate decarboxylase
MDFSRRGLFGAASLAAAGLAVAIPEAHAIPKKGAKHDPLLNFKFDIENSEGWVGEGGSARQATVEELPVSESIAGVSMRLKPGGLRELHWHAIAAEWAYVIKGHVRGTVIAPNAQAESADFGPGDVWYFPKGHGHAVQCLGPEDAHFILVFDDGHFSEFGTFSITDWITKTDPKVTSRVLGLSAESLAKVPKGELYIGFHRPSPRICATAIRTPISSRTSSVSRNSSRTCIPAARSESFLRRNSPFRRL